MKTNRIIGFFGVPLLAIALTFSACGGGGDSGGSDGGGIEPLSFFEDAMVDKWARYHGYDDSTGYLSSKRTGQAATLRSPAPTQGGTSQITFTGNWMSRIPWRATFSGSISRRAEATCILTMMIFITPKTKSGMVDTLT